MPSQSYVTKYNILPPTSPYCRSCFRASQPVSTQHTTLHRPHTQHDRAERASGGWTPTPTRFPPHPARGFISQHVTNSRPAQRPPDPLKSHFRAVRQTPSAAVLTSSANAGNRKRSPLGPPPHKTPPRPVHSPPPPGQPALLPAVERPPPSWPPPSSTPAGELHLITRPPPAAPRITPQSRPAPAVRPAP